MSRLVATAREPLIVASRLSPAALRPAHGCKAGAVAAGRPRVHDVQPQRAAVRRQLLDVEYRKPCSREHRSARAREIREMLVVDRVELDVDHQSEQVRELHGEPPGP